MAVKTQGTELYIIDPADETVLAIGCTTSIDDAGPTRNMTQVPACLDDPEGKATQVAADLAPGTLSFGLNADPREASHIRLHELLISGQTIKFAWGWNDGTGIDPTVDTNGDFDLPDTRTWRVGEGVVTNFPFNLAANSFISTTVQIASTEPGQWLKKSA